MTTFYINGKFLAQRITGVQRFARQIVKFLDINIQMWGDTRYVLLVPENYDTTFTLCNIKIRMIKGKASYFWEQFCLYRYCKKDKDSYLISLCNISPIALKSKNIVCIHDLAIFEHPEFYSRCFIMIYKYLYKHEVKNSRHIFTVSNFSKQNLVKFYGIEDKRISVVYNSVDKALGDDGIVSDKIKKLPFERLCFSVGSVSLNKNMRYVVSCAKSNPNNIFLISGEKNKAFSQKQIENNLPNNIIFAGYLSDNDLKYVYSKCQYFLFPSIYEGFGIPPLEACAFGCKKIIVSDIPTMHEIFGEKANFIDPLKYAEPIKLQDAKAYEYDDIINHFSWNDSAKKMIDLLNERIME